MISPRISWPAWGEGYDSFKRGEDPVNPYAEGTAEHDTFHDGWATALDDYEADAYGPPPKEEGETNG